MITEGNGTWLNMRRLPRIGRTWKKPSNLGKIEIRKIDKQTERDSLYKVGLADGQINRYSNI